MAYDEKLAERIDEILKPKRGIDQKKMFGGLCFLHNGNMVCGVDNNGDLMVRVGPDQYQKALAKKYAREMDFTGKPLRGFIYVSSEGIRTRKSLESWLDLGLRFTKSLPRK